MTTPSRRGTARTTGRACTRSSRSQPRDPAARHPHHPYNSNRELRTHLTPNSGSTRAHDQRADHLRPTTAARARPARRRIQTRRDPAGELRVANVNSRWVSGRRPWDTGGMATRDEVHHLIDLVPEDRIAAIGEMLRAAVETGLTDERARQLAEQLHAQPTRHGWRRNRSAFSPVRAPCRPSPIWQSGPRRYCAPNPAPPRDPGRHRADRGRRQQPRRPPPGGHPRPSRLRYRAPGPRVRADLAALTPYRSVTDYHITAQGHSARPAR